MNQQRPVPRLDLAPKLQRPLSLWNPLDYLHLLYWVFFFPQVLRWYVDTFGGGYIPEGEMNWRKRWELLQQNPIQRQLLLQGLLLTLFTPPVLGLIFQLIGFPINWVYVVIGVGSGVGSGIASGVAFGMAFGVAIFRLDNWLIGLPFDLQHLQKSSWLLPRITSLPLPYLSVRLQNWLQQDWEIGVHNVNELLTYTLQFIPVVEAINRVLAKTPSEQMIWRVSRLADTPSDWQVIRFASASLGAMLKAETIRGIWFLPINWRRRLQSSFATDTRLDTPARAAAAGFWHLYKKETTKAIAAFEVVRSLLYGEEMFTLAQTLAALYRAREPATIAALQIPTFPQEPLLRPRTWQALTSLHRVIEDTQVVLHSVSRAARSLALNRAQGELKNVLDNANTLAQAEQGLIVDIAETWKEALLSVAGEVGEISITKPIRNPYIIGDPVVGERFVGREDVMRQLEELWLMGQQLQSVVIYGHRRMGKTSILKNAANVVGSGVKVAYVNLLEVGDAPSGVGEVLIAMSDAVSLVMNLQPPPDEELLNLPLPTFRRYLQKVIETLDATSLIIALDEFEKIEDLIAAGKIPVDFMGFLRGLVQKRSKVAFAFAGLHTLEEMTADYFQPFFASVIPIHVNFQKRAATRQILANPDEDFPLDYTLEALDKIYDLTNGQPFLVQLVGFQLVRRYNDQVFEQQRPRDPVFGLTDVEAVINEDFFKRGRYYFDGVWGQAARGAAHQQAIIRAIAPHEKGLSLEILSHAIGIDGASLQPALQTLKRHDVIEEIDGRYRITVELFRRWVVQFSDQ
ncbi:ATP-binding protein [Scytonema sp. UIC 10036]|uniref:AAA family ATPase n=1 Tax=Scytonema sp. UIC 10036 TaxID=2304196 RepID=UPI0012DA4EC8|nr:ATP-binding protein [Scytonema sp. UIC 10036]MUG99361.1 ATP-binding protein [Scytonema sp. UIC 10036]